MTIEPEWRSVSISSVWREETGLSVAPEDELSWPGPRKIPNKETPMLQTRRTGSPMGWDQPGQPPCGNLVR